MVTLEMKAHAGPLPPAEDFAAYGEVEPTAPRLILEMAVRQQKHDHWMDKSTLISESAYRVLGLLMAGAIPTSAIGAAVYLALQDKTVAAALIGVVGTLATLGAAFIKGRDLRHIVNPEPGTPATPPRRRTEKRRK